MRALAIVALLAAGCSTVAHRPDGLDRAGDVAYELAELDAAAAELAAELDQGDAEIPPGSPVLASAGGYFPPLQLTTFGAGQGQARACNGAACQVSRLVVPTWTAASPMTGLICLNGSTCTKKIWFDGTNTNVTGNWIVSGGALISTNGLQTYDGITSYLSSGTGFAFVNDGVRLDLGTGSNDYFASGAGGYIYLGSTSSGGLVANELILGSAGSLLRNNSLDPFRIHTYENDGAAAVGFRLTTESSIESETAVLLSVQNVSAPAFTVDAAGAITPNVTQSLPRPTCAVAHRGKLWVTHGGGGVADTATMCRKDAAGVYAWTALY